MLNVLYVTSRRKDVRELFYASYGVWKIRLLSDPENLPDTVATGKYDVVLVDVTIPGAYIPDVLCRLASRPSRARIFLLSREYAHAFQKLSDRYGFSGYLQMSRSGFFVFAAIDRYFASIPPSLESRARYYSPCDEPLSALSASEPSISTDIEKTLLGRSPQMRDLRKLIAAMRDFTEPVLITGESGTGKDLVARLIHRHSPVSGGPLRICNMSCIPDGIAESLLFGTKKGCYTGVTDNPGLFEQSNEGTLFLDEIGDLPLSLQPKLLRVLEEGTVTRLGSSCAHAVNFRLVCATNKPLVSEVESGRFREDLFYRIDGLRIDIPPLRERPDDIPVLSALALSRYGKTLSLSALDALRHHFWRGNVRELIHCIERSARACEHPVIQREQILF